MKRVAVRVLPMALAACGTCEPGGVQVDAGADGGTATVTVTATATATEIGPASRPRWNQVPSVVARGGCRAIAVDGDARVEGALPSDGGGTAIAVESNVPPDLWIRVAAGARVVAKDSRTARETVFLGAGRARACVAGDEESWVAGGTFASSAGAEAPGAEEWVVTPLGVVRYAAAGLRVQVAADGVTATIENGVAWVWPAADAAATRSPLPDAGTAPQTEIDSEGWQRAESIVVRLRPRAGKAAGAEGAVATCASLAKSARDLAARVLSAEGGSSPIAAQVVARRVARAACAVARLRVESGSNDAALAREAASADAAWRALPLPVTP